MPFQKQKIPFILYIKLFNLLCRYHTEKALIIIHKKVRENNCTHFYTNSMFSLAGFRSVFFLNIFTILWKSKSDNINSINIFSIRCFFTSSSRFISNLLIREWDWIIFKTSLAWWHQKNLRCLHMCMTLTAFYIGKTARAKILSNHSNLFEVGFNISCWLTHLQ